MVDAILWQETHHNPVKLLERVSLARGEPMLPAGTTLIQESGMAYSFGDTK